MLDDALVTNALTRELEHEPLPADEVVAGAPTTGHATLGTLGGAEVGVWEMTPGTATDTEADEIFIVLSGAASVRFLDEDRAIALSPGSTATLRAGQRTEWTVTKTLRKVYIAAA